MTPGARAAGGDRRSARLSVKATVGVRELRPMPPGTQSQVTPAHTRHLWWYVEFESRGRAHLLGCPPRRQAPPADSVRAVNVMWTRPSPVGGWPALCRRSCSRRLHQSGERPGMVVRTVQTGPERSDQNGQFDQVLFEGPAAAVDGSAERSL